MATLRKINHVIGKVENAILEISIALITILMVSNTIGRVFFHRSIHSSEELNMILILVVTFVGLSNAARNGRHIIMTAIYDKMPVSAKRVSNIITSAVIFVLLGWIVYLSIHYTGNVYKYGRVTTVLGIPVWISMAIMPIGCILGMIQYLMTFLLNLTDKENVWAGSEKIEDLPIDEQVEKLIEEEHALEEKGEATV